MRDFFATLGYLATAAVTFGPLYHFAPNEITNSWISWLLVVVFVNFIAALCWSIFTYWPTLNKNKKIKSIYMIIHLSISIPLASFIAIGLVNIMYDGLAFGLAFAVFGGTGVVGAYLTEKKYPDIMQPDIDATKGEGI